MLSHLIRIDKYQLTNHPKNIYNVYNIYLGHMCVSQHLPFTGAKSGQSRKNIFCSVMNSLFHIVYFLQLFYNSSGGYQDPTILIMLWGCYLPVPISSSPECVVGSPRTIMTCGLSRLNAGDRRAQLSSIKSNIRDLQKTSSNPTLLTQFWNIYFSGRKLDFLYMFKNKVLIVH